MQYCSTRDKSLRVSAARAIAEGISKDGGLFVPRSFPTLSMEELVFLQSKTYLARAEFVLSRFLTDFTKDELKECVRRAYRADKFSHPDVANLHRLGDDCHVLELWHGPTCAFKDMALQLLPQLLPLSVKKELSGEQTAILVATSGDTGKAALEGFRDVAGTTVFVFYPSGGVSEMQKRQMVTQQGENVHVCAIEGNFDDAQTTVKEIFTDAQVIARLAKRGIAFSSANSINWGRLVSQIVYYISAYCDLLKTGEIAPGDLINFAVPTGNFGNILAAFYAAKMGLPVHKFICASNKNHILTDFFKTGVYDRGRPFYSTISPSMDILISSNLERLLFDVSGGDDRLITELYKNLQKTGNFCVPSPIKERLERDFYGGFCDDAKTRETIQEVFASSRYLCDPHTAVAMGVYRSYREKTGDSTKTVVVSTASPYKFPKSVLEAVGESVPLDPFDQVQKLAEFTKTSAPAQLTGLKDLPVRFTKTLQKQEMKAFVLRTLGVK